MNIAHPYRSCSLLVLAAVAGWASARRRDERRRRATQPTVEHGVDRNRWRWSETVPVHAVRTARGARSVEPGVGAGLDAPLSTSRRMTSRWRGDLAAAALTGDGQAQYSLGKVLLAL